MPSLRSAAAAVAVLGAAAPAFALPSYGGVPGGPSKKALYFLQNNPAGSSLIALDASTGQAADPVRIPTGGNGLGVVNATSGQTVMVDTLTGQGAVAADGDYIFTVNAGSNTLAMFKVKPWDPTHPEMVGEPVDTMGDFPMSVAYSDYLQTVCVLNGGTRNNVACWKNEQGQLCQAGEPRALGLNLTTPPSNDQATTSQIGFSPDQQSVVVTAKSAMMPIPSPHIWVFPMEDGTVGQTPVQSAIADVPTPFGFAFGSESDKFLLSDPSFGGSVIQVAPSTSFATEVMHTNSTLKASCWAAYSPKTTYGYLVDAASPQMVEVDMMTGAFTDTFTTDAAFMGAFDTVIDQATAYFIAAAPSVGVFDVEQKKVLQNLDLSSAPGVDDRQWWTGMAMWSNC